MKKLITTATLVLIAIFFPAVNVYANDISVVVDGQEITFPDQGPLLVDGRTLVPVRFVFEAMGFVVEWEAATETAILTRGNDRIQITMGSTTFTTNGVNHSLDVPAKNISGRILVPLRLPLESLGYELSWNAATSSSHSFDNFNQGTNTIVIASPAARILPPPPPPLSITRPRIHGGIHRIEHAGSVAYIFGSLHGGKSDWFPLASVVEDAMRRADVFAFEIDLTLPASEIDKIREDLVNLPYGQTIVELLGEELYEHYMYTLRSWAAHFGSQILLDANYTNPVIMMLSLTSSLETYLADEILKDFDGPSVDAYVLSYALQNRRPVVGLMDFEAQQRIFLAPPEEIVRHMVQEFSSLQETRDELENTAIESLRALLRYYENNDAEGLMRASYPDYVCEIETPYEEYIRMYGLNYRSTLFANEIVRILEEADEPIVLFVTIGKSHLVRHIVGPCFTSTIEQLELMGIEVTPLF